MEASYHFFDHTADMGLTVRAASLSELLAPATRGFYSLIGDLAPAAERSMTEFDLAGESAALLLRDYLSELLVVFERDHRFAVRVSEPHLSETRLAARAELASVDEASTVYDREVKAITYHELGIRRIPGGFEATLIVDI